MPLPLLLQVALFGFLAICTSSCQSSHSNNEILAELTDGFHTNNQKLTASNEDIFLSLKMKADDPRTEEKIATWLPKAEHIKAISSQIVNYLDSLQTLLSVVFFNLSSTNQLFK